MLIIFHLKERELVYIASRAFDQRKPKREEKRSTTIPKDFSDRPLTIRTRG
jgi:hypothetical protein